MPELKCKTYGIAILWGSTDIKGMRVGETSTARQPIIALILTIVAHDHMVLFWDHRLLTLLIISMVRHISILASYGSRVLITVKHTDHTSIVLINTVKNASI